MAKLPDMKVMDGWDMHKFPMSVNAGGLFVTQLTSEQSDNLKLLGYDGITITSNRAGNLVMITDTMDHAKVILEKYVAWCREKVKTYEPFLVYSFTHRADYVKDSETGEIFENGHEAGDYGGNPKVNWVKNDNTSMDKNQVFSFGVGARVWMKETSTGRDGDVTEKWIAAVHHKGLMDDAARRLNSFTCVISPIPRGFGRETPGIKIVPYDKDLAEFLHSAMMTVCKMADKMSEFFSDEETTLALSKTDAVKALEYNG